MNWIVIVIVIVISKKNCKNLVKFAKIYFETKTVIHKTWKLSTIIKSITQCWFVALPKYKNWAGIKKKKHIFFLQEFGFKIVDSSDSKTPPRPQSSFKAPPSKSSSFEPHQIKPLTTGSLPLAQKSHVINNVSFYPTRTHVHSHTIHTHVRNTRARSHARTQHTFV